MRALPLLKLLIVASYPVILLAAYASPEREVQTCRADCAAAIELPSDRGQRPVAPAVTRIAGGETLDFVVPSETRGRGRTVLAFDEAAFRDRRGDPLYVLELRPGSNRFESRPHEDGVCHAPHGCRYVVINVGTPTRPPVIRSPIIIIDPR
jgi:hypothetical protein